MKVEEVDGMCLPRGWSASEKKTQELALWQASDHESCVFSARMTFCDVRPWQFLVLRKEIISLTVIFLRFVELCGPSQILLSLSLAEEVSGVSSLSVRFLLPKALGSPN